MLRRRMVLWLVVGTSVSDSRLPDEGTACYPSPYLKVQKFQEEDSFAGTCRSFDYCRSWIVRAGGVEDATGHCFCKTFTSGLHRTDIPLPPVSGLAGAGIAVIVVQIRSTRPGEGSRRREASAQCGLSILKFLETVLWPRSSQAAEAAFWSTSSWVLPCQR